MDLLYLNLTRMEAANRYRQRAGDGMSCDDVPLGVDDDLINQIGRRTI